jgi:Zn-dependent protease with chaperone function
LVRDRDGVVGVIAPRIVIARCLVDELTPHELGAVLAYEVAHHSARDNAKLLRRRAPRR